MSSDQQLRWCVGREADAVVVAVAGEMDLSNAAEFGGALAAVLDSRPARVIADLADLSFLDSSGIH
jgi:anti-sigma B factor antagonist